MPAFRDRDEEDGGWFGSLSRIADDVGGEVRRLSQEVLTFEDDVLEEVVDIGAGLVDYAQEDLGLGERPDVHARPARPSLPLAEADAARATERAHAVFAATDGLGTDFEAVRAALTGMSPAQIQVMEAEYFTLTRRNLRATLDLETSGSDEAEVRGLLSGDPVTQAVATLRGATTGADTEDEVVRATLRSLDPAQRAAVRVELGEGFFREELAGTSEEAALARLRGDEAAAQAAEISDALHGGLLGAYGRTVGWEGLGADQQRTQEVLGELPAEEREAHRARLEAAIARRSRRDGVEGDETLAGLIRRTSERGPERDLTQALLAGDPTAIDAARLALEAESGWTEDPALIATALTLVCPAAGLAYSAYHTADAAVSGRDPRSTADAGVVRGVLERRTGEDDAAYASRIARLEARVEERYGHSVGGLLDEAFGERSTDRAYLGHLEGDGVIPPEAQLRYALEGHLGTDDELALAALRDPRGNPLPRAEVERIVAAYPGDLAAEVDGGLFDEMSGDAGFEMRELLRGAPTTDAERLEAQLRRDEWARGWGVARPLVELTGSQAPAVMDRQRDELLRLRATLGEDDELAEEDRAALAQAIARHSVGETAYRTRVDEVTEGTATAVGTAVAVSAAIAVDAMTAGLATPLLLAAAGAAGGLADLSTRLALQGGRLTNEEIAQRIAAAGVNATTAGLGVNGVSGALLSAGADEALRIGTGQTRIDDLGDVGAAGMRLAGAAGSAWVGDGISRGIEPSSTFGRGARGAVAGASRGLLQPLANVDLYGGSLEGAMRMLGTSVATNVGTGVMQEVAAHALARREGGDSEIEPRRLQTREDVERALGRRGADELAAQALRPDLDGSLATPEGRAFAAELPAAPEGMLRLADGTLAPIVSHGLSPEARALLEARRAARGDVDATGPRRVIVDGGGPTGTLAALQAYHLGHDVTLIEQREQATLPVLWNNRPGSRDILSLIDPTLESRLSSAASDMTWSERVGPDGQRTRSTPEPRPADPTRATADPRAIAADSSTWQSRAREEVTLAWQRLAELEAIETAAAAREGRAPRLELLRGYEVQALPADGDRRGVIVQRVQQMLESRGTDGQPVHTPWRPGDPVPEGHRLVRRPDGRDVHLGTPDDLLIAEGAGSRSRQLVGAEQRPVGPSAEYIAGYLEGPPLRSAPGADGVQQQGGSRLHVGTGSDGRPLHTVAGTAAHLDGVWALPEVDPSLQFGDPASIEAYFGRPMSREEAISTYYRERVAGAMEIPPESLPADGFEFGPAPFRLQSHVAGPPAADATNAHLIGDARGNSHFFASLGKVTGTGAHQMALRRYWESLASGTDPDIARALLERRLDAATRVWLRSGLPSFNGFEPERPVDPIEDALGHYRD